MKTSTQKETGKNKQQPQTQSQHLALRGCSRHTSIRLHHPPLHRLHSCPSCHTQPSIVPVLPSWYLAITPVTTGSSRQPEARHHPGKKPFSPWKLHGAPLPHSCRPPPPPPCYPTAASVRDVGQNKQDPQGQNPASSCSTGLAGCFRRPPPSPASSPREPS